MRLVVRIASLKLTLVGMFALVAATWLVNASETVTAGWTTVPLTFLSLNLLAAIVSNRTLRNEAPLFVFHVCLLAVLVLIGIGVLIRLDARVELAEGEAFDPGDVEIVQQGQWHDIDRLERVDFMQGGISVDFLPGLVRQRTRSVLEAGSGRDDARLIDIDDRASATFDGYRFVTTSNKGLSLIVTWSDAFGERRGAINFPSYPQHDWNQINTWTAPTGQALTLALRSPGIASSETPWVLQSDGMRAVVDISVPGMPAQQLRAGETLRLAGGELRIEALRLWMGYRIDYNPLLPWVFVAALMALVALSTHFLVKYRPAPRTSREFGAAAEQGA